MKYVYGKITLLGYFLEGGFIESPSKVGVKEAEIVDGFFQNKEIIIVSLERSENPTAKYQEAFVTLLFGLFNDGIFRGSVTEERQTLLDSFTFLPNNFLSAEGEFLSSDSKQIGAIDKFPSILSIRSKKLKEDGNRIIPSAMIRSGVHVGKRNIFMFHAAVNIAAYIGDDNLIDSHASVGSAAQVGNGNKIASFVSLEGVLSPANAKPVIIGNKNFLGSFVRVGTGIELEENNFLGSGVNISLGTKLRDCRAGAKIDYVSVTELLPMKNLAILPNNAKRNYQGKEVLPGEYLLVENTPEFISRFDGDERIKGR